MSMKKIKLSEASSKLFMESMQNVLELNIPAKLSYGLTKAMNNINSELKSFEASRQKSLKKYCELDENGEVVSLEDKQAKFKSDSDKDLFLKEIKDLEDVEFECYGIKLDDLEAIKDLKGIYVTGLFPIIFE